MPTRRRDKSPPPENIEPQAQLQVASTYGTKEEKKVVKINFAAVNTNNAREAGEYEGTLIGHEVKAASATSGNPTVTLKYSEDESPNRFMFKTYSLQLKALWSLKRDLVRLGATPEQMNDEDTDLDELLTSMYGYKGTLVFGDPRPYKDKDGNDKIGDNFIEIKDPTK